MVNVEDAARVVWKNQKNYWKAAQRKARAKVDTDPQLHRLGRCVDDIYTPLHLLAIKLGELSHRDKRSRDILSTYDFTQLRTKMLESTQAETEKAIAKLEAQIELLKVEQARVEESLKTYVL